ncbi:uncharacterized protein LOC125764201 isoform X2 [Anopheles funestus]|nr:uncharacterized protein LOC125764201 isoform X2 [Anopheles funestus]
MGAGTYANAASPGPGLLRRRYSVPEIIMRKHTLAQQKTDDESLWLHHDTNHNVIEVVVNKHTGTASARGMLNGRFSGHQRTPPHRKSFGLRHHRDHHSSMTGRSSSVESGGGGVERAGSNDWLAGTVQTGTLTATGSDPNLAALKHRNLAGGRCSSPLCNGIGSSRAVATGTGGSLRSIHNNSLSCSSSSSVNGGPLANGGVVGGVGVVAGVGSCGGQQQHYPLVPAYRDGDFSMRKTTLLRRMWSRELRRYERSGSWSPPLRRTPPRIYSVESIIASVEGHQSPSRADDSESVLGERVAGRPGSSGSGSSVGSGRCATTATTTTTGTTDTTGTTSCLECAKLERQYNGGFGTGKKLLTRTPSRDIDCTAGQASGVPSPVHVSPTDPATVDDRRQRRRRRMCSSQTADLGESEPIILAAVSAAAPTVLEGDEHEREDVNRRVNDHDVDDDLEDEYPSHSSSVSSIASQSYRVPSATRVRPADNESDLSEFLQQERLAGADGDGRDRPPAREVTGVRVGSADASDYPRERASVADGTAGAAAATAAARAPAPVEPSEPAAVEQQFPPGSKRRPSEDSSVALSAALSEDSDSGEEAGSETGIQGQTVNGVADAERARLDEYISGLLLDNLNNLADAKELVLATDVRDGETEILGVYSERRAQLREPKQTTVESDRQNNNNQFLASEPQFGGTMKQKLTEKYIGDGGGVVCNSPPQSDKRKLSPKLGAGEEVECDKENEEDVANNNNNNNNNNKNSNQNNNSDNGPSERGHRRQKHRSKGNGFFLRSGSRSPRAIDATINGGAAEIDLNGKYYFPAYGLETDPSDNTDIASEPEGLVLGKIGTGSTYDRGSVVVPRFSAMPRTESMEVQPSSTNSAEDDVDGADGAGERDEEDDEDEIDDSDASSLVDSLDGFGPPQLVESVTRTRKPRQPKADVGESTTSSTDRSPRHEKGEAFFVPIHAETTAALRIDERVVVADTMPLRIKERLNNRRRLMKWKQEQENLKKQRKMMRLIEQKRFYGEPAIQVISTIDKSISRKEFIPPGAKKSVFGGASTAVIRDTSTPSAPTPFRAMKPKKRAGGGPAATGSALRSELGMLESYKIDGKGNMQIQNTASGAGGRKGGAGPPSVAAKNPWGMTADKRQGKPPQTHSTASTTVGSSGRTSTGRTGTGKAPPTTDGRRRQQVLKDVQQMTLYPQADLTPDIEGGPRRVYQKTEIQEGDKHIEILEIVECADSAPRNRHGSVRPPRVHSGGRRHERGGGRGDSGSRHRSRIPVPIYRFGQYRRSTHSRDGSPLSTGSNPKVDRMIADLLLEALTNPEEVGVKLVRTPEALRDASRASSKSRPSGASTSKKSVSTTGNSGGSGNSANNNNNLLTPRRTASGRYTQKFEVIPEERSSVSIESSTEELSTGGGRKKGPHPSPRRVSFDENHQILNRDELEAPGGTTLVVPTPSPKRQSVTSSPAKSPTRSQPVAGVKKQGTATVMTSAGNTGTTNTNTTTTTSRGKAAIQSDVIEEKGWIGFSTQHEDMATPVHTGQDDEDTRLHIVPRGALEQAPSRSPPHNGRSVVRTITIGNCVPEAIEHHRARIPDHSHIVSNSSPHGDGIALGADDGPTCNAYDDIRDVHHHPASTADSFVTDSLNTKLTPASGPSFPSLPTSAIRCCETLVETGRQTNGEKQRNGKEPGEIVSYQHHHHHHRLPAPPFQHQIREENAWQVFQTGDCKVIQSKIEYYETSIHRTPLTTGGGDGGEFFTSETTALCPHTAPLSTADSLEEMARSSTGSWHRQRTTSFGAGSDAPPKTSDTTCSSCCFCNPELHNHGASLKSITDGCFYCRAKLGQSPTRSFPAPPTPPNIQTSPVPPSPQTPITELTPTPSLHEIAVPVRKSSLAPRPVGKDVKINEPNVPAREDIPSRRCDVPPKTKHPKPSSDAFADKLGKRSTVKSSTSNATVTTVTGSEEGPQKPLPPVPGAQTPKMARKKPNEPGAVLNRPKYTNHLTRATTVVQSVQKEIKNELRAPIRVLPKTAKEVNNRKEKERQIGLSLPKDYDCRTRPPVNVVEDEPMLVAGGSAETHGYDNETTSSDTSDGNSTADSTPNVSPFKRPNLQQQQQQQSLQSSQPPTAATRWKTNSERNLSQLAKQKLVSASRWGSKWRKGVTKDSQQLEQTDRSQLAGDDEVMASVGSCSELSPLKTGTSGGGGGVGTIGSTAGTTTSNIISGITQSSSNQGWTVTVAGNYNPEMAPDVEMRLSFPKGAAGAGSGGKSALTSSAATGSLSHAPSGSYTNSNGPSTAAGRNRQTHQFVDGDPLDGIGYPGASRSTSRAGALPPTSSQAPGILNPRRNLTRSDGTGAGTTTKDYRLPNVGSTHNILARPTARKAIKTVECSVVASATRTIANSYHQLSHQHQAANSGQQQQQHYLASRAPPMATGRGGRPRPSNPLLPQPTAQVLHPTLQNGSGGKFLSSSSPSLVSQQQHPSQRFHHTEPSYHLEDYGNVYYGHQQQQSHPRRMSLDSQQQQQHQAGSPIATDCLSVMGNAIAPELKPRVPTMSERDLTRRHHVCYTRTQPYFS